MKNHAATETSKLHIFKNEPIICKLADLGEARSTFLQAKVISNNSCTHFVRRVSPAYMTPEILVEESILKSAGIEQLKAIDVWALVMTFFVILNPDQKNPFQYDLEKRRACDAGLNVSDALLYFLRKKAMPSFSQKYEEIQASCYSKLRYVFFKYLEFNASERVTVNEVMENLTEDSSVVITSLALCQATALEFKDRKIVKANIDPEILQVTNACAFLSLGILNQLTKNKFEDHKSLAESIIIDFPKKFNIY